MRSYQIIAVFIIGIFSSTELFAQDSLIVKSSSWMLRTSYFQIKDQHNVGLVFNGATLNFGYNHSKLKEHRLFEYEGLLGVGPGFSRGMTMIQTQFKFVDLFYGFEILEGSKAKYYIGPYFSTNYHYQFYPETHGGITSWFTLYELGIKLKGKWDIGENTIVASFSNSMIGLASRPVEDRDPYNYSLKFTDFVSNSHSNMEFGSFGLLNHTQLTVDYIFKGRKRQKSIGYQFNYIAYSDAPTYKFMDHSIYLNLYLKKSSK